MGTATTVNRVASSLSQIYTTRADKYEKRTQEDVISDAEAVSCCLWGSRVYHLIFMIMTIPTDRPTGECYTAADISRRNNETD